MKLGRTRPARLICDMSLALNRDSKKRSVPNFQKSFDSIEVDENNVFKLNSKIMKAFFFFVGENLDVFSENVIKQQINGENNARPSESEAPQVYSEIKFEKVKDMLHDRKERAKVRKNISLLHQYANQLFPFNGEQRLVFIFVAFQLHPGFNKLSHFLSTTVQALQLVNEVHSQ